MEKANDPDALDYSERPSRRGFLVTLAKISLAAGAVIAGIGATATGALASCCTGTPYCPSYTCPQGDTEGSMTCCFDHNQQSFFCLPCYHSNGNFDCTATASALCGG